MKKTLAILASAALLVSLGVSSVAYASGARDRGGQQARPVGENPLDEQAREPRILNPHGVSVAGFVLSDDSAASLRAAQPGSDLAKSKNVLARPLVLTRGITSEDEVLSERQRIIEQRLDSTAGKARGARVDSFLQGEE